MLWAARTVQRHLGQEDHACWSAGSEVFICAYTESICRGYSWFYVAEQLLIIIASHFRLLQNIPPILHYELEKSANSVLKLLGQLVVFIEKWTFNIEEFHFFGPLFCCMKSMDLHV